MLARREQKDGNKSEQCKTLKQEKEEKINKEK